MFASFLKISLRKLYREKLYAAINIAGLSISLTCSIILGLYLRNELSYDRHFDQHERLYRIEMESTANGAQTVSAKTGSTLGWRLASEFSDIEAFATIIKSVNPVYMRYGDETVRWDNLISTQSNYFQMFSHDILYGDPVTALEAPGSIAISETFARRYFGDRNPLGEIVSDIDRAPLTIRLVFADLPENTHLKYDIVVSISNFPPPIRDDEEGINQYVNLIAANFYNYVQLAEGFDPADFPAMASAFLQRNTPERLQAVQQNTGTRFQLTPLADIHYGSGLLNDQPTGNMTILIAFLAVAVFITLIACINYMNLATARVTGRAREVGLHKILGASRKKLITQFLGEAMLYSLAAAICAVILTKILLNTGFVTQLLGTSLSLSLLDEPRLILWIGLFALGVGLLAGSYPALYLSSWAPLSALVHSGRNAGRNNALFRQTLVLLQIALSITVIATTLLASSQLRFLLNRDPGYEVENLVNIPLNQTLQQQLPVIKNELNQYNGVLGVTSHSFSPTSTGFGFPLTVNIGGLSYQRTLVDENFLSVMGLSMNAGRFFSGDRLSDEDKLIVNEAFVRSQGWNDPFDSTETRGWAIIGVIDDFNFDSVRNPIGPLMIAPEARRPDGTSAASTLTVRISDRNIPETLAYLEDTIARFGPARPFEYQFMEDWYDQFFLEEQRQLILVGLFAGICIFIAMLGLYCLTAYTTEQRKKEISMRKVLGASAAQIVFLLFKNMLWLVLAGAVIGSLAAYLLINEWLANFAYRITPNLVPFIISTLGVLLLAALTVILQSYKTAQSDPVDALQSE